MTRLFAETALLPSGWAKNVHVEIKSNGELGSINSNAEPSSDSERVGILLPAPVNAHSHAFQRAMAGLTEKRGPDPVDSFWTWRKLMYRFLNQLSPEDIEAITAHVQLEMLEAGYATNVEFHYLHHGIDGEPYDNLAETSQRVAAAADQTGIGLTLLPVHYQYGGCDKRSLGAGQIRFGNDFQRYASLYELAASAVANLPPDSGIGVAPHSLRAVAPEDLVGLKSLAAGNPFHMHLAEQIPEVHEVEATWGARPVEWFLANFDVDDTCCLIHCTQMTPRETENLAKTGAVAGLCPITEANLGDGIFDGVRWLGNRGHIAIGSDSNIQISLVGELRILEYSQRLRDHTRSALATSEKSTGRHLFDLMVEGGARAAGRNTGKIRTGMLADLMCLDSTHIDLASRTGDMILDCYIFAGSDQMVTDVWSAGRHQVKEGKHIDRQTILNRYSKTMARLEDHL
ncbi:MAG: formimidoylglutamate deiminase [Pseudomonadota bacterium]